jgi:serine/threonine-protein kinase HipA
VISKPFDVFVYITLPGQTQAITCGRFQVDEIAGGRVGKFVYRKSYLENRDRVEIDPVQLMISTGEQRTASLGGLFGAFRDSAPDHWGRLVIERALKRTGFTEIEYLLNAPDDRIGALGFGLGMEPPAPVREFNKTIVLPELQETAEAVLAERPVEGPEAEQIRRLLLLNTAMGGARPKAAVEDNDGLWIAKFQTPTDRWNDPRVEHAMLNLARNCGLSVADSRLDNAGGRDILLVRRFDRDRSTEGYLRHRMISSMTVLGSEGTSDAREKWSYPLLADQMRRIVGDPSECLAELFRRMTFNALISNLDDHPRNHALIAKDGPWFISPAYDLTPQPSHSVEHRDLAMTVGKFGRWANRENLLSVAGRFLLSNVEAGNCIDTMWAIVERAWYPLCREAGVSDKDCEKIAPAFLYDGLKYSASETDTPLFLPS